MASMPVSAVTRGGCETVSSGSSIATRNEAFLSPQAILTCVCGVGDQGERLRLAAGAGRGRHGDHGQHRPRGLADAPIVLHPAAVGVEEVDPLGAVHRAAAPQADDQLGLVAAGDGQAGLDVLGRRVLVHAVEQLRLDAGPPQRRMPRSAWPAATMPGSVTTRARRAPNSPANSPSESILSGPKTIRVRG